MAEKAQRVWREVSAGQSGHHTLIIQEPNETDVVLYDESIRKGSSFMDTVSHSFSYYCSSGEEITSVVAYDKWGDDTGGNPVKTSGGVGYREVTIKVTSKYNRGFNFRVVVFGSKPGSKPKPKPSPRPTGSSTYKDLLLKEPEKNDVFGLLKENAADWKAFATALNVDDGFADGLRRKGEMYTDEGKLEDILRRWIQSQCSDVTWNQVFKVLQGMHLNDVARQVKSFLERDDTNRKYKDRNDFERFTFDN